MSVLKSAHKEETISFCSYFLRERTHFPKSPESPSPFIMGCISEYVSIGEQNLPPQNISLEWRLFPDENNQAPKDWGRNSDHLSNCLKDTEALVHEGSCHHRITVIWVRCVNTEEPSTVCCWKFFTVSHCLCLIQQTFAYQTFCFSTAFYPFEFLNDYPQHSLLSLAEVGI